MKNQEDEFYSELDQKALHRSCCTFQTLFIFFAILIIVAIISTIYVYKKIKAYNLPSKIVAISFQDKNSFEQKLKLSGGEENFELTISQEELTSVISDGISTGNFILKNPQVIINPSGIDVYGTLTKPLSSEIKIATAEKIENNKLKLEVTKITAGTLTLPKFVNNGVSESLNKVLDEKFQVLYDKYKIESVELLDSKMIIKGKKK